MCKLEGILKFCTCTAKQATRLDQFWVFYRLNAEKDFRIIGRVAIPARLRPRVHAENRRLLLARLNEDDAFDIDLQSAEGDRLAVTLRCAEEDREQDPRRSDLITYGYERQNGRWVEAQFDPHSWQWHHDQEHFGKLQATPAPEAAPCRGTRPR